MRVLLKRREESKRLLEPGKALTIDSIAIFRIPIADYRFQF